MEKVTFIKEFTEKLKQRIVEGKWKFKTILDEDSREYGGTTYKNISRVELIDPEEKDNEPKTLVTFSIDVSDPYLGWIYDYSFVYVKDKKVVTEISGCCHSHEEGLDTGDMSEFEAIENAMGELRWLQEKVTKEENKANFESALDSI